MDEKKARYIFKAIINSSVKPGHHGYFVWAECLGLSDFGFNETMITFSLEDGVWLEKNLPLPGISVACWLVREKSGRPRACKARFWSEIDQRRVANSKSKHYYSEISFEDS